MKSAGVVAICASNRFGLLKKGESCGDGVTNQWMSLAIMEKQRPENSAGQWWFNLWVKFLVLARRKSAAVLRRNASLSLELNHSGAGAELGPCCQNKGTLKKSVKKEEI